ncbi:MAG: CUB domain-containing protein [Bacteroidales bacterium]
MEGSFEDGSGPTENHAQNANCEWIINPQTELDSVTKIKLSFKYFSTGSGDFVTIYDGESTSDPVLGTYSGSTLPTDNIYSTGNKVLITFIGDGDPVTGDGFKIEYESVLPSYGSGMTQFTTPTGTFGDGSGEFGYINGASFGWILNPTWAADITLSFTEFNTQEEDILTIKDATTQDVLATYSGDYSIGSLPEPIYCESAKLLVLWSADAAFNAPGFTAEWTVGNVGVKEENTQFDNLQVYPNPADNMLNVSFSLDNNQSFAIKLISTTGQVVYQENTSEFSGNYVNSIDLSGISKGVYFLNIANESGTVNKKVVVK